MELVLETPELEHTARKRPDSASRFTHPPFTGVFSSHLAISNSADRFRSNSHMSRKPSACKLA